MLLTGGNIVTDSGLKKRDIMIDEGRIVSVSPLRIRISDFRNTDYTDLEKRVIRCDNSFIIPGLTDVHVHFREPGQGYKETIRTGSMAAAKGGYTAVCTMPNVSPPPEDMESLQTQLDIIEKDAVIKVHPYGKITRGNELSQMDEMKDLVAGYSDDGQGVQSDELMEAAMKEAKRLDKIIAAHCEDERYPAGDPQREWAHIMRDVKLCLKTGCRYHVCHVSTAKSVEIIREAKKAGADISCETAPHYLLLNGQDVPDEGRFRMNPPLRSERDREELLKGIADGTIDMIATDHAPHAPEEKSGGASGGLPGVSGIESAFPVLYTKLVVTGTITLQRLVELMAYAPRERFGLKNMQRRAGAEGQPADLAVMETGVAHFISSQDFISMGRSTPFEGMKVKCRNIMTLMDGIPVWEAGEQEHR